MNPVAIRLLNQQLICPQFKDPAEVVSYMGAVQAQEYRLMRWAVAMRTRRPSAKAFKKSFDSGRIVRLHLMRGTWQLVSSEDYWPLLDLCASKALAVTRGWMHSNRISIPDDEIARIREILARTAEDKGSATKEDFIQSLADRGIRMDDHRLSYHIRLGEYSGLLCSGDLFPMKHSYALLRDKLPGRSPVPRDEALALLARKYFRSHGTATLEDFVWWSGLGRGDCRQGLQDARTRGFRRGGVILLPSYDEYLIGYKSRQVSVHPDHSHHAHNQRGIFWPVVLLDGVVVGNWSTPGGVPQVEVFHPGAELDEDAVLAETARYRKFMRE